MSLTPSTSTLTSAPILATGLFSLIELKQHIHEMGRFDELADQVVGKETYSGTFDSSR